MVRNISYWVLESVVLTLLVGCSSKEKNAPMKFSNSTFESNNPQSAIERNKILDSLRYNSISNTQHNNYSGVAVSVNLYYDAGYEQGHEDGYNDGLENLRGDSFDDSCRYRGKKRKEYELGYEEGYEAGFDDGFGDSDIDSEDEE